jgi:glyoxylase-like metal-dependent hydrolase (beta-lactamase superfamily II)
VKRALFLLTLAAMLPAPAAHTEADNYDVYAVRFATIANFPVSSLVAGADRARRMDIAMMVWVLKGDGRIALVDSGFHRDRYFQQFTVKDYVPPPEAIAPLGITPGDVTDIFLSHMHWDHAGGLDLFPSARVWVQKDEYDYYTSDAW